MPPSGASKGSGSSSSKLRLAGQPGYVSSRQHKKDNAKRNFGNRYFLSHHAGVDPASDDDLPSNSHGLNPFSNPFQPPGAGQPADLLNNVMSLAGLTPNQILPPELQQNKSFAELYGNIGGVPYRAPGFATASQVLAGPSLPNPLAQPEVAIDDDDDGGFAHAAETYDQYKPAKLALGVDHPDPVVETLSLASAPPPDVTYRLRMPESIGDEGKLSSLQLEAIVYASQSHEKVLPTDQRAGYLIGDGAGVGKGRTIAGIIYENSLHGRNKAIWISVSNDLKYDAERDLADIGADIPVHALNKLKYGKIEAKKGVLFATYSCLIGETQGGRGDYSTRLKQILKWCGKNFSGVIVFDECHRAKNLCPAVGGKPTKTGMAVLDLQAKLPGARVVYASATGASEPRNMAYMTRLGLWGKGTPFETFLEFQASVEKRGVGAMELIAMDMKLRGVYIARQLSFSGVSFDIREVPLKPEYQVLYDDCVDLWAFAKEKFAEAAKLFEADPRLVKQMWGQFWGAHQRFFKYLCLAGKVQYAVQLAKEAVKDGKCAVIGLQSTGEARTLEMLEEKGELTEFVSTARAVFQSLVEKQFPAYDRRRMFEITGMTNVLEEEMEEQMLNQEPDAVQPANGKRKHPQRRERKQVVSYKLPVISDSENESADETKKVKKASGTKRKKPPTPKKQKGRKRRRDVESDADSDFSLDSDESGSESDDDESGDTSESDSSVISSDNENPWLKMMAARKKSKKKSPTIVKKEVDSPPPADDADSSSLVSPKEILAKAQALKDELMERFEMLADRLPPNTLDDLIDQLGGPSQVAEMTGRKGRVVQTSGGRVTYEARNDCDVALDMLNLKEKERFMDGEKLIAVISEAASSGISIQADKRVKNQRRRVHITLELSWSADKAIQQFGRTHRSNQASAPEYVFLTTDIAGEKRFASAVARRLESLGALTHGDRRATDSRDLSMFNIDSKYARSAIEQILKNIMYGCNEDRIKALDYGGDFLREARKALRDAGVITEGRGTGCLTIDKDSSNVGKFLNRLLGVPFKLQNCIFEYFSKTTESLIEVAKRDGRFDLGILELGFGSVEVNQEKKLEFRGEGWKNVPVYLYTVSVERGLSWKSAVDILNEYDDKHSGFYLSKQMMSGKRTISLAVLKSGQRKDGQKIPNHKLMYHVYRPYSGMQLKLESLDEIARKGTLTGMEKAKPVWNDMYESMAKRCLHAFWNGNCKHAGSCDIGLRRRTYHILTGSLLSVWKEVGEVMYSNEKNRKIQNVRVRLDNNLRIVGIIIPNNLKELLVKLLVGNGFAQKAETAPISERLSDDSDTDDCEILE